MAKDMSLKTIGTIGHSGATYKAIEYQGDAIVKLCMDERMAITNMAVEMGAKVGLMNPDDKAQNYLKGIDPGVSFEPMFSDDDASYCAVYNFSADDLKPMIACPHEVDNVTEIEDVKGTVIHQAYIGSCTGGRYSDLEAAANILKGQKVNNSVRLLVSPASQEIWQRASASGLLEIMAKAGAVILAPTCGVCVGVHSGLLAAGENCLSSTNRNFIGRMGSREANIYLASPVSVAASAITGSITDPRDFLKEGF